MARVKVATYNIHHGAGRGRQVASPAVFSEIAALDVDVLALQEVDRFVVRSWFLDQVALASRASGLGHSSYAMTRRLGPGGQYGIALLTRWPMSSLQHIALPAHGSEQRAAIVASVRHDSAPFTVVNTHLHNSTEIAGRQLEYLLAAVAGRPDPVILAGDLNAGEQVVGPHLAQHGFVPAHSGPTFPSDRPVKRIDWLAARGMGTEMAPAEVGYGQASDHRALSMYVEPGGPVP